MISLCNDQLDEAGHSPSNEVLDSAVITSDLMVDSNDLYISQHAPIRRMPPKILQLIFVHCLSITHCIPESGIISPVPEGIFVKPAAGAAPLLLSQICSHWRSLATKTPQLWSSIHIEFSETGVATDLIKLWLDRSGNRPLSIFLQCYDNIPMVVVWETLAHYLPRWYRFWLYTMDAQNFAGIKASGYGKAPLLQDFRLYNYASTHGPTLPSAVKSMMRFAPMQELTWVSFNPLASDIIVAPWNRLTQLSLFTFFADVCLGILKQCINLTHFIIFLEDEQLPSQDPSITLPKLRSLHFRSSFSSAQRIFDTLTLPALVELKSTVMEEYTTFEASSPYPHITSLLHRSSCPLTKLILLDESLSESTLVESLRCVSRSLVELDVTAQSPGFGDFICGLLTRTGDKDSTNLCPMLEVLKLQGPGFESCSKGVLPDMVESRWKMETSGHHISTVKLTYSRTKKPARGKEDLERLAQFSNEGLLLEIIPWY